MFSRRTSALFLLLFSSPLMAASAADVSLAEVRSSLEAAIASRPAISTTYTVSYEPDEIVRGPGKFALVPWGPNEYRWAVSGHRLMVTATYPDRRQTRMTMTFDGELGYKLHEENDGQATLLVTESIDARYASTATKPDVILGRALPLSDLTLIEALKLPGATVIGNESVDGATCVRIDVSGIATRENRTPLRLSVWIDPSRDHLPRRVSARYESDEPRLSKVEFTWTTTEFQQVPNGATGNTTWFPKTARYRQKNGRHELIIEKAIVRGEFPVGHFRPQAPSGAALYNLTKGKSVPTFVGGIGSIDQEVDRLVTQAVAAPLPALTVPADATPHKGLGWPIFVFTGSSVFLVVAVMLWWRQRG